MRALRAERLPAAPKRVAQPWINDAQRRLEIGRAIASLRNQSFSDWELIVVDNASGDVLAYVGSADFFDTAISATMPAALARRISSGGVLSVTAMLKLRVCGPSAGVPSSSTVS